MPLVPGATQSMEGGDRCATEDALLFISFVRAVNAGENCSDDPFNPHRRAVLQKQKSRTYEAAPSASVQEGIHGEKERAEFVCVHCDAKYIYKRCLINHLTKSHSTDVNICSKEFQ